MSRKNKTASNHNPAAAKREAVLGQEKKNKKWWPVILSAVMAITLVSIAAFVLWPASPTGAGTDSAQVGLPGGDVITLPAAQFDDGQAKFFKHKTPDGLEIRFFVLKSSDGVIRAAFDACDVCWRSGLGYAQDVDFMVCRNCGSRFASIKVNEVRGGCNPAPLNRSLEGGQVRIRVVDILDGSRYFNLSS